jgi:hypothetical protein
MFSFAKYWVHSSFFTSFRHHRQTIIMFELVSARVYMRKPEGSNLLSAIEKSFNLQNDFRAITDIFLNIENQDHQLVY